MSAAAPPVSDCGCVESTSSGGGGGTGSGIYPLHGTDNPNTAGLVPPFSTDLIWTYQQWIDAIAGPPVNYFYWNPNLQTWQ